MVIFMIVLGRAGCRLGLLDMFLSRCYPHGDILILGLNDFGHVGLIDNSALVICHGLGDCDECAGGERSKG